MSFGTSFESCNKLTFSAIQKKRTLLPQRSAHDWQALEVQEAEIPRLLEPRLLSSPDEKTPTTNAAFPSQRQVLALESIKRSLKQSIQGTSKEPKSVPATSRASPLNRNRSNNSSTD